MYPFFYQKFLFPFYEGFIRGRKTLKYLRELEHNQWLNTKEIEELQWIELKKLLKHAYENVPFYAKTFDEHGVIPDSIKYPDDFRKIPIIDKSIIKSNWSEMIAGNIPNILTKSTGGSTGEPLHFGYTRDSYQWRMAVKIRGYSWAGYKDGDKVAFLWGVPVGKISPISALKSGLHHKIQNAKYFNIFNLTPKTMKAYLEEMRIYKPKHIVAYGLGMYYFAKFINDNGWSAFPVKSIILGAEKVQKDQIEVIESVFNCPVFDSYGCREFMLIASQCEHRQGMHISSDNLYVETIKNNFQAPYGEIGEVVITDLHNYGMPFIRYKNGDLAVRGHENCPCGRGLPLITNVEGRITDMIVAAHGKIITGLFFPHLMKEFHEVDRFQVIQEDRENLIIKIVPKDGNSNVRMETMRREIQKVLGQGMQIDFQLVREIPLTPSGKHRVTISKVSYELE